MSLSEKSIGQEFSPETMDFSEHYYKEEDVKESVKKLIKRGVKCGCEKCNDWVDIIKEEFGKELI